MSRLIDEAARRYGRLTVIERGPNKGDRPTWWCKCDCGNTTLARGADLRSGHTTSCGCRWREIRLITGRTHGLSDHPLYTSWLNMHDRCRNPNYHSYHRYGGRGITVCERWSGPDGFPHFLADMGERPTGLTLERIDNDGAYEPGNCEWVTWKAQRDNQ